MNHTGPSTPEASVDGSAPGEESGNDASRASQARNAMATPSRINAMNQTDQRPPESQILQHSANSSLQGVPVEQSVLANWTIASASQQIAGSQNSRTTSPAESALLSRGIPSPQGQPVHIQPSPSTSASPQATVALWAALPALALLQTTPREPTNHVANLTGALLRPQTYSAVNYRVDLSSQRGTGVQQPQQAAILDLQRLLNNPEVQQQLVSAITSHITAAAQTLPLQTMNTHLNNPVRNESVTLSHSTSAQNLLQPQVLVALCAALPSLLGNVQNSLNAVAPPDTLFPVAQSPTAPLMSLPSWSHPANSNAQSFLHFDGRSGLTPASVAPVAAVSTDTATVASPPAEQTTIESPQGSFGSARPFGEPVTPVCLYLEYDQQILTQYQCLLRQQIELFEAGPEDVAASVKGRIKPLRLGQLGLRCRHCRIVPPPQRTRATVYFPGTARGVYQICQNMGKKHLCDKCPQIPPPLKQRLRDMFNSKEDNNRQAGGKSYWVESLAVLGVYEDTTTSMMRLKPR